ncbi:uncharacterized protein KD926_001637 [Aspergillus affinis]|uniref:uncharacterized protein n=1 Tax=Aspergillus affinis TaxID=1070780 RepID=UPI0022FE6639|nr:uncharacterized protein KD926_001637 [Aspergillus affinis]KAI9036624.1 hypothetical protein KD926_001637 [Aspergillus affinis]
MAANSDLHILIIGAGITGLLLAQSLKKAGIRYSIFEKEVTLNYRSNEWTMAIHWALDRLQTLLPEERCRALNDVSCNPAIPLDAGGRYPIIHGETGNILVAVPYEKGLRVPRSGMRALCAEGIDVEYGKELIDVAFTERGGVVAIFEDGSMVSGTLLIGADGPRSTVREFAMKSIEKAAVTRFPIFHTNMTASYDADKARFLRQRFPTSYLALSERSFHAFQSNGPDNPASWVFHLAMAWFIDGDEPSSYAERLRLIRQRAQTLAEPARSAFVWLPDDTRANKAELSFWVSQPWDNRDGRITLVGDAAHPMPPFRGQGLNHCICDVSHLLEGIKNVVDGKSALNDVITAYEAEMIPRGREEVTCSVENGYMLHDWEKVRQSAVFTKGFKPMDRHNHEGHEGMQPGDRSIDKWCSTITATWEYALKGAVTILGLRAPGFLKIYKVHLLAYRKKGMSEDAYHEYLSIHHAIVVKNHIARFGIVGYTMTHNTSETKVMAAQLLGPVPRADRQIADYDCVVQIMFRDIQDYLKARDDPFFREVIGPDHEHFSDTERTMFLTGWVEKLIVDGVIL